MDDAAVLTPPPGRLAISTDSFVVDPIVFPGGDIGSLAVHGTVNDVAMRGAKPLWLTVGFVLEEGLSLALLTQVVESMARAAQEAGVLIVAGDTKVVGRGQADKLFINTTGVGVLPDGLDIGAHLAAPGDAVLVSGTMGDHGTTIMAAREGLNLDAPLKSDSAALNGLVASLLGACPGIHVLRDPTRGGVASSLNEIAQRSRVGIQMDENKIPVNSAVRSACELLGMDPLFVANEGKLLAIVPPDSAEAVLEAMRRHPLGQKAAIIGRVVEQHPGMLVARTGIGGTRVVPMQIGEQLPRIC
jgi:hydrogenase expression/formation protein HypE